MIVEDCQYCGKGFDSRPCREHMVWDENLKRYGFAPGNYMCKCHACGETHIADKRAQTCRSCAELFLERGL